MRNLSQVVTSLPPAMGGVGDFCVKLWEHWPEPQPHWSFLVTAGAAATQAQWSEVKLVEFEKSRIGLVTALESVKAKTVVLHYVGHGFHPKGCPIWLPKALKEWKTVSSERRVLVMFHELYATGPIWSSSFWLKWSAQKILQDLILVADLWLTSCSRYQFELVNKFAANPKKGALIPVGANILSVKPVNFARPWPLVIGEKLKVVIFGLAKTRLWALNVHAKLLSSLCERGWVESITLAGTSGIDAKITREMAQHRADIGHAHLWHEAFDLTANQVSQLLITQDLGLVNNELDILTKSGTFAAFSAHGVLSAICSKKELVENDLEQSVFLYDSSSKLTLKCLETKMQNEQEVYHKKQALQMLMQTSLSWKTIALSWVKNLEKLDNL